MKIKRKSFKPLRKNRPKRHTPVRFHLMLYTINLLLFVLLLWGGFSAWRWLQKPTTLPFKHIVLKVPADHVDINSIRHILLHNIKGGFFTFDPARLSTALHKNVWVERAQFRRIFPSTLEVTIREYIPLAYWQKSKILTGSGDVISPVQTNGLVLPYLSGPDGSMKFVMNEYRYATNILQPISLTVRDLSLSSRLAWVIYLSNGIKVRLGRENIDKRLLRLVAVYPRVIAARAADVVSIDLRYPNGMAVRWRKH